MWRRFCRDRLAVAAAVVLVVIVVLAVGAGEIAPYSYSAFVAGPLESPSWAHWMGTDDLGRDLWSRVVYGARLSVEVAALSQAIALCIGVIVGGVAGWVEGVVGSILMRMTDVVIAFPPFMVAIILLSLLGDSTFILAVALGLSMWPILARLVRAQVLSLREEEFVEAARALGSSPVRTLRDHVLPHSLGVVFVQVTFGMSQAIFTQAFLAFIGLGPPEPTPSWGSLISDGFQYVGQDDNLVMFPVIAVALSVLALNFVGDGLRDALEVRGE